MARDPKALAKVFASFIRDKSILVADSSGPCRTTIANILTTMGAKSTQIRLVSGFSDAEKELTKTPAHLLITDYELDKRCGMDLLTLQRDRLGKNEKSIFILATNNSSQSAVARAAEEDVDTYLIKPFTSEVLRNTIAFCVAQKVEPSQYVKTIERGKQELAEQKLEDALKTFEFCTTLNKAPALAYYYLAQCHELKKDLETAESNYNSGLSYNNIHYKCLVGLYENLMARKKNVEAYGILKKIAQYFPANPQRLTSVLRLAIVTQSYEDVEGYYRVFTSIDERNDEMIRYICAALVVCGKYYLQNDHRSRSLELFQKAAITASGRTKILREIIQALVESKLAKEADEFLRRFPADTQNSTDYVAMNFLIGDQSLPKTISVEKGRALLTKGHHDPVVYRILIQRSNEAGLKAAAEDLLQTAIAKFPAYKSVFEKSFSQAESTHKLTES